MTYLTDRSSTSSLSSSLATLRSVENSWWTTRYQRGPLELALQIRKQYWHAHNHGNITFNFKHKIFIYTTWSASGIQRSAVIIRNWIKQTCSLVYVDVNTVLFIYFFLPVGIFVWAMLSVISEASWWYSHVHVYVCQSEKVYKIYHMYVNLSIKDLIRKSILVVWLSNAAARHFSTADCSRDRTWTSYINKVTSEKYRKKNVYKANMYLHGNKSSKEYATTADNILR